LIDLDHISESNINRQLHALDNTLGQSKVQAMRERIALINPSCDVIGVEEFVDANNWPSIAGLEVWDNVSPLVVLDACDQVRAKTAMAAWAIHHGVNFITVGAAGGKRHAHRVDIEDLSLTTHDPLLAQLRYRLRKEQGAARIGKIGVACVFSREPVMQPDAHPVTNDKASTNSDATDGSLNCHGYGSVVSVTSTFGVCAAGWLLEKIASGF
jgi:tRNA A37 threonylcarbamoyladenosine dehydratase